MEDVLAGGGRPEPPGSERISLQKKRRIPTEFSIGKLIIPSVFIRYRRTTDGTEQVGKNYRRNFPSVFIDGQIHRYIPISFTDG